MPWKRAQLLTWRSAADNKLTSVVSSSAIGMDIPVAGSFGKSMSNAHRIFITLRACKAMVWNSGFDNRKFCTNDGVSA